MRRMLVSVAVMALLAMGMVGRAVALESAIKAMLHPELEKKVLIIHDSNIPEIQKLVSEPHKWIICNLQLSPEHLTPADAAVVMNWVNDGGSLWFQDCRMAASFGMEAAPLTPEDISRAEAREGAYNTHKKHKGLAAVAYPVNPEEEIMTEVTAVVAFLLPVGDDQWSGVKGGGDVVGLLRATPNPEADTAYKMVAAYKKVGKGTVIFKPLVWEESLASDRFQVNLREWVGGYPVPQLANFGRNTGQKSIVTGSGASGLDTITLDTGDVVHGTIQNKQFSYIEMTSMSTGEALARDTVQTIEVGGAGEDIVTLKSGQSIHGMIDFGGGSSLDIKLQDGSMKHLRKTEVKRIDFAQAEKKHG